MLMAAGSAASSVVAHEGSVTLEQRVTRDSPADPRLAPYTHYVMHLILPDLFKATFTKTSVGDFVDFQNTARCQHGLYGRAPSLYVASEVLTHAEFTGTKPHYLSATQLLLGQLGATSLRQLWHHGLAPSVAIKEHGKTVAERGYWGSSLLHQDDISGGGTFVLLYPLTAAKYFDGGDSAQPFIRLTVDWGDTWSGCDSATEATMEHLVGSLQHDVRLVPKK